jgi:Tol biopolymer transport system component
MRPISGLPVDASRPALGKRPGGYTSLVFTNISAKQTILRFSTARGAGAPAVELAPSNRSQNHPRYSHDGKRLAFSSTRTGYEEIWVADADGTHPVQVTALRHLLTEMGHWSPDDSTIAFVSQDRGARQIYLAGSSGGPAVAITNEEGIEFGTGWSQDGSGYYYGSLRTGRREIRKALRGGGPPQQMTVDGGQYGFESRGAVFYYWRPNAGQGASLMRRGADGDRQVPLVFPGGTANVTTVREGFYYKTANNDVGFFEEATGRSTRVFNHPAMPYNEFTISPDGRWFATEFAAQPRYDLMIMEHFH